MSTSDVIATCSVFVAVLALFATAWQAWLSHRHNRLSVRPLLVWHIERTTHTGSSSIVYVVKNLGLGPALVQDRYFTKDDIRFSPPDFKLDEVEAFLSTVLGQKVQYHLKQFGLPGKMAAIPSQCEVRVAHIEFPDITPGQLGTIEELAGCVGFHIHYKSMYGELFELHAPSKNGH